MILVTFDQLHSDRSAANRRVKNSKRLNKSAKITHLVEARFLDFEFLVTYAT